MSRGSREAQRRRRQRQAQQARAAAASSPAPGGAATRGAGGGPRAASRGAVPGPGAGRIDPVAEYRASLRHPRLQRAGLALALLLLCVQQAISAKGREAPALLGTMGAALVAVFYITALLAYFRTVYRVRRHDPAAWRPGASMMGRMLGVPLGIRDPNSRLRDRLLLWLTGGLAAALLALSFVHKPGATH